MKRGRSVEVEVWRAIRQVLPLGSAAQVIGPDGDLRNDLGIDSIGLVSLVDLLEQGLEIDLLSASARLAEVRRVNELVGLCSELCAAIARG